ncbi:MAG: ABC transporter permease [Trueperaceae bacterium]
MTVFVLRRVFALIPVLLVVAVVSFALVHLTPGDPAANIVGDDATAEDIRLMREKLGLDRPLIVQFGSWAGNALVGDLGRSIYTSRPVMQSIIARLEPTLVLTGYSLLIAMALGLLAGVAGAVYRNSVLDQTLLVTSLLGVSMPNFWLGINLILLFSVSWRLFPVAGYVPLDEGLLRTLHSLTLPALALGFSQSAIIARMTRTSMLEVLGQDYVRTARAKGLNPRSVIFRHALRNALVSVVTVVGVVVTVLLSGSIVVESVFSLPGLGRLMIEGVQRRDYPVIQGVILFVAAINVVVNLLVDLSYLLIDPRIEYS